MSTAARKARKRAGIPFTKPAKVGTPIADRASTRRASDSLIRSVARKLRLAGKPADTDSIAAEIKKGAER